MQFSPKMGKMSFLPPGIDVTTPEIQFHSGREPLQSVTLGSPCPLVMGRANIWQWCVQKWQKWPLKFPTIFFPLGLVNFWTSHRCPHRCPQMEQPRRAKPGAANQPLGLVKGITSHHKYDFQKSCWILTTANTILLQISLTVERGKYLVLYLKWWIISSLH